MKAIAHLIIAGTIAPFMLVCGIPNASGASPEPAARFIVSEQWMAADGLPVDTVNSLAIGTGGQLWIGSHDGLSRFDGFGFTHFNADSDPALPNNRINQVVTAGGQVIIRFENNEFGTIDENGYRQIGKVIRENLRPDDAGLWYTEGEHLMRWEPATGIQQVAAFDGLELIYPDAAGSRLFLSTDAPAVVEFDPNENRTGIVTDSLDEPVLALATSPEGHLAILTRFNLHVFDTRNNSPVQIFPFLLTQWDYRFMSWTPEGWLATLDGPPPYGRLMRIGPQGIESLESAPYEFHHFVLSRTDDQGDLWVNEGTRLFRNGELIHECEDPIYDFRFDRYGQVWLGTRQGGLKRLSEPVMQSACPQGDCLEYPNTYLVTEHGDGLLIGNQFALYHHDPAEQTWTRLMGMYPMSALADGDDLLVGGNGLCRLQPDGTCAGGQPTPDPEIRMLLRDHTDAVWMGSDRGLFRRAPDGQWSDQPLTLSFVRTAAALDHERMIFGTVDDGVLMGRTLSPTQPIEVIAHTDNGMASNAVRSLHVLADQRVLVGLEDRGMCLLDPERGVERCVSVAEGLPHHSVHRMIEDDQSRLWVNTNNGIYVVAIDHLVDFFEERAAELTVRRFDSRHGMPGNEGNGNLHQAGTRTADGRIWFPNQHGVAVIHPDRVQEKDHRLSATITALGHAADAELRLPPEARLLRTRLGTTALRGAENVQFRYRLDEDAPWNFIGNQTELAFESLAPGHYGLQVQARYRDGQWPEETALLAFGVPPRLTERRSFWFLLGLAGLLLLGGLLWRERGQVFRLEHEVEQRTSDLRQALATVKAQAFDIRRSAERRHQLFLAISHELRTPLTLILGPLRDQPEPPDKQQLERMQHSAEQMRTLIDQILDLEHAGHGHPDDTRPEQLPALIIRTLEVVTIAAEEKSVDIQCAVHETDQPLWLQADSARLERALTIVLDNAIKYAPRCGLVRLSLTVPPYSGHAAIHIEDNGPGIPHDHREILFEPFVRGNTEQSGLGLGLALCRRIIEQHGGTVTVGDSRLGGACFTLELPLIDASIKPSDPVSPTTARILIVDDNPGIRAHVADILGARYQVFVAASGHEGERLARSDRPDIMLVDASMPHINGFELIRRLRDNDETATIPIILFTAHGHRNMEIKAFHTGADHYLEKPFTADQLLGRVSRILARSRSAAKVQTKSASPAQHSPDIPDKNFSTFMARLEQVMSDHLEDSELDVDQLAALSGTSRASLYRRIKELRNETPAEFIRTFRLRRGAEMLRQTDARISEIAFAVGFRRLPAFTRAFRAYYNCTPSGYRKASH